MANLRRKTDKKKLLEMLDDYRKEKCLGPSNCKACIFSVDDGSGCALNLICNVIEYNLSITKDLACKQWHHMLYDHFGKSNDDELEETNEKE